MILKNAHIYDGSFELVRKDIEISGETITDISENIDGKDTVDLSGCVIIPGFIDIHIHGCAGTDITSGQKEAAGIMSAHLVKNGVTSFCPASMTLGVSELEKAFAYTAQTLGKESGAYIHGINMEGPFISKAKKGAQAEENILEPDAEVFRKLASLCPVSLVDIAPEVNGADEFIKQISPVCTVSAAHSTADYAAGKNAIDLGITHATHLFNAMPQITSREPGLSGALLDDERVYCELICDGIHISPAVVRITFKALGEDRAVVISDSMMAAGLEDGEYSLGGQKVFVKDKAARLADGTLAGSTANIFDEFKNLISFGIDTKTALKACTINPAKSIGKDKITGSIEAGKLADLCVLSGDLQSIKAVFVKGRKVL